MKITFLGTAAGVPEKNRDCTSVLIESRGKLYVIDAGCSVANKIVDLGKNIEDVEAVFITHSHGDHIYGLIDLIRVVNNQKMFVNAKCSFYLPELSIVNALKKYFSTVITDIREDVCKFYIFTGGVVFEDKNIKVSAIPNSHLYESDRPSYSFLVEGEGKKIVFSGDLSQELSKGDFPEIAKHEEIDLLVLEYAHFDVENMVEHFDECKTKLLYFNHISRFEEKKPLIEALNRSGRFDFSIKYALDMEEIYLI